MEGCEAFVGFKVPVFWWHVLSNCWDRHTATPSRRITLCVALLGSSPIVCVVWCGVVWCGVVRCGVVWCGVVWCGVVWCGVVWCGVCGVE